MANKWFKHFNDTLIGDTMQEILASGRNADKSVVLFFYIMELMSRQHCNDVVVMNIKQTARRLHTTAARILECVENLSRICEGLLFTYPTVSGGLLEGKSRVGGGLVEGKSRPTLDLVEGCLQITVRNWSELQTSGDKIKTKNKIKNKDKDKEEDKDKYSTEGVPSVPTSAPVSVPILAPKKIKPPPDPDQKTLGSKVWEAYADAFSKRYKTEPIRNAMTSSQAANLGKHLGGDAVEVVRFYVQHNDAYFIREHHPIGICLAKAHGLYAQWKTGRMVTAQTARKLEQSDYAKEQMKRLMEKHHG